MEKEHQIGCVAGVEAGRPAGRDGEDLDDEEVEGSRVLQTACVSAV